MPWSPAGFSTRLHPPAFALLIALAGCGGDPAAGGDSGDPGDSAGDRAGAGDGEAERQVSACFFTDSTIECGPASGDDSRVRVDDFYPSACLDGDHDGDRVPDFLDPDDHGGGFDDPLRCSTCDRGPGEHGDFRFEVDGDEAKLDRGTVYFLDHERDRLLVPAPYGEIVAIEFSAGTRIDDGYPAPGAEIRVEGWIDDDGVVQADRLKVLCAAPEPVRPEDVPPECEPVDPTAE
jgi:hypothetical protein